MFDAGAHALALQPIDIGNRHAAGQAGVFGIAFEVAPCQRRAVDIDRRRQQHVRPLILCLLCQGCPHLFHQFGVPGGAQRRAYRKAGRGRPGRTARAARSVRPVGHPHHRDAKSFERHAVPQVGPSQQ